VSRGEEIFEQLQRQARADSRATGTPTPTQEYLTRHGLESFLDRLTRTDHRDAFVLKGGVLLASYGARRPTKDIDAEAIGADLTPVEIRQVVADIAGVDADDGVDFDTSTIDIDSIREADEYPALRVKIRASIGAHTIVVAWDISTGDPIVPAPKTVQVPRLLGPPIELLGYAPETTIAEKGVTILERGIASTRWRDYVDIVQLAAHHDIDMNVLADSARAIARYRKVTLAPIGSSVAGYGAFGQAKWAAWRRKERLEAVSESDLDEQMKRVAEVIDPAFGAEVSAAE
jgi:hypothetical protein